MDLNKLSWLESLSPVSLKDFPHHSGPWEGQWGTEFPEARNLCLKSTCWKGRFERRRGTGCFMGWQKWWALADGERCCVVLWDRRAQWLFHWLRSDPETCQRPWTREALNIQIALSDSTHCDTQVASVYSASHVFSSVILFLHFPSSSNHPVCKGLKLYSPEADHMISHWVHAVYLEGDPRNHGKDDAEVRQREEGSQHRHTGE